MIINDHHLILSIILFIKWRADYLLNLYYHLLISIYKEKFLLRNKIQKTIYVHF